jgi:hypothetical protein
MRTIKNLLYLGMLAAALAIGFQRWKLLVIALLSAASYIPDFPFWPAWLPLGLGVVGYLFFFGAALATRKPILLRHHVVVLVLLGVVLLLRMWELLSPVPEHEWRGPDEAPPPVQLAKAAGHLKAGLDRVAVEPDSGFPTEVQEVERLLRRSGKLPFSGFRGHGFRLPVALVVVPAAEGPVLRVRPGDRAGTLYYAVRDDGSQYWISVVGLERYPAGPPALLRGPENDPIVLTSGEEEP